MGNFGGEILLTEAEFIAGKDISGFIFDLNTVVDFIASAQKKDVSAKYLLAIKAINPSPGGKTLVITAASSLDEKIFAVVPNERNKVIEHPGTKGKIGFPNPPLPNKDLDTTQSVTFTIQ